MKHSKSMVINLCYFECMCRNQLRKKGNLLRNTEYFSGVHVRLQLGLKNRTGIPPGTSTPFFCPLCGFLLPSFCRIAHLLFFFLNAVMDTEDKTIIWDLNILHVDPPGKTECLSLFIQILSERKSLGSVWAWYLFLYPFVMRRQVVLHELCFWDHEMPGDWLPWNFPRRETGNFTNKWIIYVGFKW